jgi:hypothetical protein
VQIQTPSGTGGVDSRIRGVVERGVLESEAAGEGFPGVVVVDLR